MAKKYEEIGSSEVDRLFYAFSHAAVRGVGLVSVLFRVEGAHHIPQDDGAIIASNHIDGTDILFGPAAVPKRHVTPIARRGIMEAPILGSIFERWGALTIDRPDGGENFARESVEMIEEVLNKGRLLWVFSSGTRTPGYWPGRSKRGVAMFARHSSKPTIPAAIKGTDRLSDQRVTVKFGARIKPPRNRAEDEEFLTRLMVTQQWLFNRIPHSYHYKNPETEESAQAEL